jgi:hypothetical protein
VRSEKTAKRPALCFSIAALRTLCYLGQLNLRALEGSALEGRRGHGFDVCFHVRCAAMRAAAAASSPAGRGPAGVGGGGNMPRSAPVGDNDLGVRGHSFKARKLEPFTLQKALA